MFHLGWFLRKGFGVYGWGQPWSGNIARRHRQPWPVYRLATSLERAGFDYMMLEDSSVVPDIYAGSFERSLRPGSYAHDPMALIPLLVAATKHLGLIATASTSLLPAVPGGPAARHPGPPPGGPGGLEHGDLAARTRAAQNFGYDQRRARPALRDGRRVDGGLVNALWDSWEPDAIVNGRRDRRSSPTTPRSTHRLRGQVLQVPRPAEHRARAAGPPGRSARPAARPAGREFAAKHADTVIAAVHGVPAMKEYRDDIRARMVATGRNPDDCKVLFLISPVIGETEAEAQERTSGQRERGSPSRATWRTSQDHQHRLLEARPGRAPGPT